MILAMQLSVFTDCNRCKISVKVKVSDRRYSGKAVVIKDNAVIGVYSSRIEAVEKNQREHEPGTFLVQVCGPEGDTPLVFHSRVAFS